MKYYRFRSMSVLFMASLLVGSGSSGGGTMEDPALIVEWERTFGGMSQEIAYSVQQTTDGGYILAGVTGWMGHEDAWVVKTDKTGVLQWNRTFGGALRDEVRAVRQTLDGGYILAGYTTSYGAGNSDFWLVKTAANGTEEWSRTFGRDDYEAAYDVQQTADGGYILVGFTNSLGTGNSNAWVVKTDPYGTKQWGRTFGGEGSDQIYSVQQTADGGYVLAGYFTCEDCQDETTKRDLWLIKTNASGIVQWNRALAGVGEYSEARKVRQTRDGGYVVVGFTGGPFRAGYDIWAGKINEEGILQWNTSWSGENELDDTLWDVQETMDGGYLLLGYLDAQVWLGKISEIGVQEWEFTFEEEIRSILYAIQPTADGGYILAGYNEASEAINGDFWLVKLGVREETTTVPEGDLLIVFLGFIEGMLIMVVKRHRR